MTQDSPFSPDALILKVRRIITDPAGYFRDMPRSGGYLEPAGFIVVMALIMGAVTAVWSLLGAGAGGMAAGGFGAILFTPVIMLIGAFIGAAILFVIWKLMGSEQNYETAFRCQSSVAAIYPIVAVVSVVPYLGTILSVAWGAFLLIEASVQVHERPRKLATTVFGILAVLMILSNTAGERASREMAERMESMGMDAESLENMSPEEAGRKMGEFMRGLEEARKQDS
jgi:hypothetical protein